MAIPKPLRHVKSASGHALEYDLISAGTVYDGALCVKANGAIAECGSDPSEVSYFTQNANTASVPGSSAGLILAGKIRSTDTFEINAYHTTAANATVPDSALDALADYGVIKATVSGVVAWFLDLEETTTDVVRLIARLDSATEQYPRCQVQFVQAPLTFE